MFDIKRVRITFKDKEPIMLIKLYDYESSQNLVIEFKFTSVHDSVSCCVCPIYRSDEISSVEVKSLAMYIDECFPCIIDLYRKRGLL